MIKTCSPHYPSYLFFKLQYYLYFVHLFIILCTHLIYFVIQHFSHLLNFSDSSKESSQNDILRTDPFWKLHFNPITFIAVACEFRCFCKTYSNFFKGLTVFNCFPYYEFINFYQFFNLPFPNKKIISFFTI